MKNDLDSTSSNSSTISNDNDNDNDNDNNEFQFEDVESLVDIDTTLQIQLKTDYNIHSSPCIGNKTKKSSDDINNNKRRGSIKQILIDIDARSHLEVADSKHRYSKHLRLYFQEYIRVHGDTDWQQQHQIHQQKDNDEHSNNNWLNFKGFFEWLDSVQKPEHPLCLRSILDSDTVLYLSSFEERKEFAYEICNDGLLRKYNNNSECHSCSEDDLLNTDGDGWIFVLKDKIVYAHAKDTKSRPRFHHSTFLAGEPVEAAGLLVCENGVILKLFPHSGHYRPHDHHLLSMLEFFYRKNVSLNVMQVDAQRVLKVSRLQNTDGEKMKKINTVHMMNGYAVLHFLRTKDLFYNTGTAKLIKLYSNSPSLSVRKFQSPSLEYSNFGDSDSSFYSYDKSGSNDDSHLFSPDDSTSSNLQIRAFLLKSLLYEEKPLKLSYPERNEIDTLKILLNDSPVATGP